MTLFEKIAAGELPSFKLYEDDNFLAILDKFPSHLAQALVFPKQATTSKFSMINDEIIKGAMVIAKKVAKLIEENLDNVARVTIVIEGFEVDHFHVKLIPTYNPNPTDYAPLHKYPKHEASDEELTNLRDKIVGEN